MSGVIDDFIRIFRKELKFSCKNGEYLAPRPYRNAAVSFRDCSIDDYEERREILTGDAGLNVFLFPAHKIPGCDLLSDSGTTTMTIRQWASMLLGDEAYGSNEGYYELKEQIKETFGSDWVSTSSGPGKETLFIFHQGRAAENAFFTILSRTLARSLPEENVELSSELLPELRKRIEGKVNAIAETSTSRTKPFYIIPSNSHFDTTEGNIEDKLMVALNLPCKEHISNDELFLFRGNMDIEELSNLLANEKARVPLVYLTITNNTGGGQPVSMANIKEIRKITREHNIPFFFDACRFAENAWFIKQNEKGYSDRSIDEIVHEMFSYVDGFHISLKKDGLVNIGGALVIKEDGLFTKRYPHFKEELTDYQIMTEGHPTYGGLAGRDLKAIAEGLRTVVKEKYLQHRILQVRRFGEKLSSYGIPLIKPYGGHAVYIDMDRFFGADQVDDEFKAISFTALALIGGHRLCELGLYAFGKFNGKGEIPPDPRVNYVRAAVPRLVYEDQDLLATAEVVRILYENRDKIPPVKVEYGRELKLRHFKSRFSFKI